MECLGTNKTICGSSRFKIGYADTIGVRKCMEDEYCIRGFFRGKNNEELIAVFDGHGGIESAQFASQNLHKILEEKLNLSNDLNIEKHLRDSIIETNEKLKQSGLSGGCTSLVVLIVENKIFVANVGDSRAVLCDNDQAVRLSFDHKPGEESEQKRIMDLGGKITTQIDMLGNVISRVQGQLSVSRSLGDFNLHPYVIAEPDIKIAEIKKNYRFFNFSM